MKIAIITHVTHVEKGNQYFGYAPYIREMNIWLNYVDKAIVVAPLENEDITAIHESYNSGIVSFKEVPEFNITTFSNLIKALLMLPRIWVVIYKAMREADHIHLRCPGNMGLIGAFVQILFPNKQKTAKYAGNWDPNSKQPWSYRLQKWVLSNTFLTRNMQVLVYGEWKGSTSNIKSFFTATYSEEEIGRLGEEEVGRLGERENEDFDFAQSDKKDQNSLSLRAESRTTENNFAFAQSDKCDIADKEIGGDGEMEIGRWGEEEIGGNGEMEIGRLKEEEIEGDGDALRFLFVGTLSIGKQPLYAIQLVEELYKRGEKVILELYGEGVLRKELEHYITQNNLETIVVLKGNQSKETILNAYQTSHFLILPSKSEGWPKVVAEAMFWGCVPIASPVSCVSYMMGYGSRGVVLQVDLIQDVSQIKTIINDQKLYKKMELEGQNWSRQFTTDKFETEISKLLGRGF